MNNKSPENEIFKLSIHEAKHRAKDFRATVDNPEVREDPFSKTIAPSLLSADHIVDYVRETGLIAPFSSDTSKSGRLKKASYEARIGDVAYNFEVPNQDGKVSGNDPKLFWTRNGGNLVLDPNSIVFVECDLEFRLPSFIALRFNLAISHVHRGLLLGTGPLIDPGFWGKLCIPIHNLTDEPYEIKPDDGLIWIEFTKTTSSTAKGRLPSGDGNWDIKEFIKRAQNQVVDKNDRVGIRSGISQALSDAAKANDSIATATKAAKDTKTASENAKDRVSTIGIGGGIAAAIAIFGLFLALVSVVISYKTDTRAIFSELKPALQNLEKDYNQHIDNLDLSGQSNREAQATISLLSEMVSDLGESVANLTIQLKAELAKRIESEEQLRAELGASERRFNDLLDSLSTDCSSQADGEKTEFCLSIIPDSVE